MKREVEVALRAYNRRIRLPRAPGVPSLVDEWDAITAVESPQALETDAKPHKRSGEYVKADLEKLAEVELLKRACYK